VVIYKRILSQGKSKFGKHIFYGVRTDAGIGFNSFYRDVCL
jgi:hypothetical protein